MKKLLPLVFLLGCNRYTPEQKLIVAFMKEHANDPSSYEPLSFEFIGPYSYRSIGLTDDTTRQGDLILHSFRAANAFGAVMKTEMLFTYDQSMERVSPLADSVATRLLDQ